MDGVAREFLGLARAFRTTHVAEHAAAVGAVERIVLAAQARCYHRQTTGPRADVQVIQWAEVVPSVGRLDLTISTGRGCISATEYRLAPSEFRFKYWHGDGEDDIAVLTCTKFMATADRVRFTSTAVACVSLHALARRYQLGWDNSNAAICRDLLTLANLPPETVERGGEFSTPQVADGGRWLGSVIEIAEKGDPMTIAVARSFISADMTASDDDDAAA